MDKFGLSSIITTLSITLVEGVVKLPIEAIIVSSRRDSARLLYRSSSSARLFIFSAKHEAEEAGEAGEPGKAGHEHQPSGSVRFGLDSSRADRVGTVWEWAMRNAKCERRKGFSLNRLPGCMSHIGPRSQVRDLMTCSGGGVCGADS